MEEGTLILAQRLKEIRDKEKYLSSWESFADYLLEIRMTESKASRLITVYEKWVLEGGFSEQELAPIGWSNLYEARNHVSQKVLDELTHRQDKDARDYIKELNSGISMDDCKHDLYRIEVCRKCGRRTQIL